MQIRGAIFMSKHNVEQQQSSTQLNELNEIFMTPANKIVAERFSAENQASSADCCNGQCAGGGCHCGV